jgi:hypothetical protein
MQMKVLGIISVILCVYASGTEEDMGVLWNSTLSIYILQESL